MASTREMQTKDGRIFWQITVSRGRSRTAATRRFYWPQGMTRRKAEKALQQAVVDFEREVEGGKAFSRAERKKIEEAEALQAAQRRSVAAYADIYLQEKRRLVASGKMSPATVESYQAFFDLHILPKIGSCLLAEVTVPQLRELVLSFSENHAQSSTVKLHAILNGLFSAAFRDELIATNPMLKVQRPRSDTTKAKTSSAAKAFSASDVRRIFQCLESEPLFWRCFVRFMADTGARRGEVCGLQWADIDFSTGMVVIRRNLQYTVGSGVIEKAPKNGKERAVDIGPDTVAFCNSSGKNKQRLFVLIGFSRAGTAQNRYSPRRLITGSPVLASGTGSPVFILTRCGIQARHCPCRTAATFPALRSGSDTLTIPSLCECTFTATKKAFAAPGMLSDAP